MPRRRKPALPKCLAKTRKGSPCGRHAGWGTQHHGVGRCSSHGGSSPQAQLGGMVQLARREQQVMGAPLSIEPEDAILECIRIAAGEVWYASERIADLKDEDAVGPLRSLKLGPAQGEDAERVAELTGQTLPAVQEMRFGAPQLHVWIQVRFQAMDRLVAYSVAALRAGVAKRLVDVAEGQGQLIANGFRALVVALGHDPNAPEVREALRAQLTVLSGGGA